jgi:hypothetical protein
MCSCAPRVLARARAAYSSKHGPKAHCMHDFEDAGVEADNVEHVAVGGIGNGETRAGDGDDDVRLDMQC